FKQRLANAAAAVRGLDEQVFQIKAVAAAEGGIIVEPEREARRRAVPEGEVAEHPRILSKEVAHHVGVACHDLMQEPFVFRKLAHEREDQRGVGPLGGTDREHGAYAASAERPRTARTRSPAMTSARRRSFSGRRERSKSGCHRCSTAVA